MLINSLPLDPRGIKNASFATKLINQDSRVNPRPTALKGIPHTDDTIFVLCPQKQLNSVSVCLYTLKLRAIIPKRAAAVATISSAVI